MVTSPQIILGVPCPQPCPSHRGHNHPSGLQKPLPFATLPAPDPPATSHLSHPSPPSCAWLAPGTPGGLHVHCVQSESHPSPSCGSTAPAAPAPFSCCKPRVFISKASLVPALSSLDCSPAFDFVALALFIEIALLCLLICLERKLPETQKRDHPGSAGAWGTAGHDCVRDGTRAHRPPATPTGGVVPLQRQMALEQHGGWGS